MSKLSGKKGSGGLVKGQASLFSFFKKTPAKQDVQDSLQISENNTKTEKDDAFRSSTDGETKKAKYVLVEENKTLFVGRSVKVYWPNEKQWYTGKIASYNADENTHEIHYDDGDHEELCLDKEKFQFIADEDSPSKKRCHSQPSMNSEKAKRLKSRQIEAESDEEWTAPVSSDESEDESEDYAAESLSDSSGEETPAYRSKKKPFSRLNKGNEGETRKRKTPDTINSRPPKPTSSSLKITPPLCNYSRFSADSSPVPSHRSHSPISTPSVSAPLARSHLTPSPRQGNPVNSGKSRDQSQNVNRIPLPEGVTGLGSHEHNSWEWLKIENRRDKDGRKVNDPDYNPSTIFIPPSVLKDQTPAMRQWFELKQDNFDIVLFFKVGKFYELFHMDADVGMSELDLIYMKGNKAHSGFPEISYGKYASQLVAKGYRVARVEQTETPDMLKERNAMLKKKKSPAAKVVAREMCSIMSKGTRTFCHLDDLSLLESSAVGQSNSLLLCVKENESMSSSESDKCGDAVVEYGLCFVDPVLYTVTLAQFQDDLLRNRLRTAISHHKPTEVLLERGAHSDETQGTLKLLCPGASIVVLRKEEIPSKGAETLQMLDEGEYFKKTGTPSVLEASIEGLKDNSSNLMMCSLGGCLRYLKRSLIDYEVLSHGRCYGYVPPDLADFKTVGSSCTVENHKSKAWVDVEQSSDEDVAQFNKKHMILDAITINNLEILTNTFDHGEKGSLWAFMNRCRTPFGCRLLKGWVCKPLLDVRDIEHRREAVEDLMTGISAQAEEVRGLLKGCPDVERLLSRVHANGLKKRGNGGHSHPENRAIMYENQRYNTRKIRDFIDLLSGFDILVKVGETCGDAVVKTAKSKLLRSAIAPTSFGGKFPLEEVRDLLKSFREIFDEKQAKRDGFIRPRAGKDPEYDQAKADVAEIEGWFEEYLKEQKKQSGIADLAYFGSNKDRYQLEVPIKKSSQVPHSWTSKSQKKTHRRYWTPLIEDKLSKLIECEDRLKEAQMDTMRRVFEKFDRSITLWSTTVACVSLLDALLALASVSSAPDYVWPSMVDKDSQSGSSVMNVRGGRHPMLEKTMEDQGDGSFIANDVVLGGCTALDKGLSQDCSPSDVEFGPKMMLVSGPNMGGKSTLLRQTCLIAIMAQIGCKVPAEKATLTPVDRIFTRLGASDKILSGQSTFFVELAETAMILKYATSDSLCILDELGRGTSTFDGTAIAHAVVEHLVSRIRCITLFATHYHSLVNDWSLDPRVKLGHMDCLVEDKQGENDSETSMPFAGEEVTFLYKLCDGSSPRSYGINVARLARLPQEILEVAQRQSAVFEDQLSKKTNVSIDERGEIELKSLLAKIYDRVLSIAHSDITSAEMVWLVGEIWQRYKHLQASCKPLSNIPTH